MVMYMTTRNTFFCIMFQFSSYEGKETTVSPLQDFFTTEPFVSYFIANTFVFFDIIIVGHDNKILKKKPMY